MNDTFVTAAEAQSLTGKSERTIRRFLKSNVETHPEHFEMEARNGRDVWLIEAAFLERQYPFVSAGQNGTVTSRGNAGQMPQDNKALQRKWQEKKEKKHDTFSEEGSTNGDSVRTEDSSKPDSHYGVHEENKKLWDLVANLQDQVAKKDKQLDRYFTEQGELMKTMGRLMEQDNLLLARSQEATIVVGPEDKGVSNPIDVENVSTVKKSTKKPSKKKPKSVVKSKDSAEAVAEAKTAKEKKSWWSFR